MWAMARRLGHMSITSVRSPTSSVGTPARQAASSPRSSAKATVWPALEISRAASRRSVVFPMPGREMSRALFRPPFSSIAAASPFPAPRTSRDTRTQRALMYVNAPMRPSSSA